MQQSVEPMRRPVSYAALLARDDFVNAKRDHKVWRNSQSYRAAWRQEFADLANL